jgi:gluconate 2-dehydrogenase gamma chain
MAGQRPSRRELLQALTLATAASAFPGFCRWSFALGEKTGQASGVVHPVYQPQFFTAPQYKTIETLTDLILPPIPDSEGKVQVGARDAGVAEFIDFMVFSDSSLQPKFRNGLTWLDHAASPASSSFVSLSAAEQTALLERLAYKAKHKDGEKSGQGFFLLVRKYTVMGFYTSKIGLESLDFPGLKFYSESPGCSHPGNPEHVGL